MSFSTRSLARGSAISVQFAETEQSVVNSASVDFQYSLTFISVHVRPYSFQSFLSTVFMKMEIEIKADFWSARLNYSSFVPSDATCCSLFWLKKRRRRKKKKEILSSRSIFPRGINKQWRCSTRHVRGVAASKNKNGVVTREGADAGEIYHCTRDIYARSARTRTAWKHEEGNKESRGAKNDDGDPRHKSRTRVEQVDRFDRTMHGVAY